MTRKIPIRSRKQRGQSLLETALMIVVIFNVVFWIFEVGWLTYTHSVMADAANEGVRYAIVRSGGDSAGTKAKVLTFARTSLHNTNAISVSVNFPAGNATPPNPVEVTVSYTYVPWLSPFINTPPMKAYARGSMVAP
jgi:Flp pilus assembly protein TadG